MTDAKGSIDLKGLLPGDLSALVAEMGEKPYRADQVFAWIHSRGVSEVGQMTNLPRRFREALGEIAHITRLRQVARHASSAGGAEKLLLELSGGDQVEAVLIRDDGRRTACLSAQVGCALGCRFCATARMGFTGDLTAGQIIDQLMQLMAVAAERGERVTNVVMMGMGEPLLNYDQVVLALRLMRLDKGVGIGGRRTTVSTAGHVPGIRRLAAEDLNVGLAISLNATTDETRNRIMPINRKHPIAELLDAAQHYFDCRGRRVTFEYVLLEGITDTDADAVRLAELTRDIPCKINLIPYNPPDPEVGGNTGEMAQFGRPSQERLRHFARILKSRSQRTVTLRDSRGGDIAAACGQLHCRADARSGERRG